MGEIIEYPICNNVFTEEMKKYPIFSILESDIYRTYPININSDFSIFCRPDLNPSKDIFSIGCYDEISLVLEIEKIYNFKLYDQECEKFNNFKFTDLHDLIRLIKEESEYCSDGLLSWIRENINELSKVRGFYESYLRDIKLNLILINNS